MFLRFVRYTLTLVILLTLLNCTTTSSRYRFDLYMEGSYGRKLAKVENTKFVVQSRFITTPNDIVLQGSSNNTLITTISTNWKQSDKKVKEVLAFDEIARYRVYFSISEPVRTATIELKENSVAQLSGNYDISPEKKLYTPVKGTLVIDSVSDSHLFAKINGIYKNIDGAMLRIDGAFKAKYR